MDAVWYIQIKTNDREVATQSMIYAAQELGRQVFVEKYIPFDDEHDLTFLPTDRPVVFHGAIGCARSVQKRNLNLKPFAWFDFDKLCCHSYYAFWGKYLASSNYVFVPLGEIRRKADWLFEYVGADNKVFIRPDSNDKIFTGEVVAKERLEAFMNWAYTEGEIPTTLCVIGTPIEIFREWRFFIADGKVIAGSQYMDGRCLCVDPHYPEEAVDFAEEVANVWSPHPFYCLDVGSTEKGYKVIECGSANCAGLYAAEVRPIVEAMTRIAEREYS